MKCGKPVETMEQEYCQDCAKQKHIFDQGRGLWIQKQPVSRGIYQFKFHNKRYYASVFAEEMMKRLQITHLSKRCYRELSGGQQQRVLLARALCATRKILLLDEPVSGLDPQMTEEMYRLIEKINREDKITIIMISHDIRGAMEYASHILQIGQEVIFESKENYLRAHTKRSVLGNTGGKK